MHKYTKILYKFYFIPLFFISLETVAIPPAFAERIFFAGYNGGFYLKSEEEGGMEVRLGGAFQTDYRYYTEKQRADNRFDIRRGRLVFRGRLTRYFLFGMEYEFQGNETKNLVDAYGEMTFYPMHGLRFGQFKEPFSLEWQCRDKSLYFAERSMGYYLTPKRDIGLMLHGTFFTDTFNYAIGLFNGDGVDGSSSGSVHDSPEVATRIVFSPFKNTTRRWLNYFQIGGSFTFSDIDLANVDLQVRSTGMAGTNRSLYLLGSNTKFGVLNDSRSRTRYAFESFWGNGPFALSGEYIHFSYTDLKPSGSSFKNADFSSWYVSMLFFLTGEEAVLSKSVLNPVYPNRFFNPSEKTWGAFCLGLRVEGFSGDPDWIVADAFTSVRHAKAISMALNWILYPMHRFILDYTHTNFSDLLRSRVLPDGTVNYIKRENVFTARFSMDF
ncbi:MAG: hypothetical protein KJ737_13700 [Proteobacteria bacterium]|nr:hypothetical protein [Pseudomonadota bacterium]